MNILTIPHKKRRSRTIPPLESGDHLTLREFERRYERMPEVKKAELIEGVVYMPSPVHFQSHAEPHSLIVTWLGTYLAATPGIHLGDNATVRLDADNEVQPDVLLRLDESRGGHSRVSDDDYVEGAPELIVEIAASSASIDLRDKWNAYRRNGVREYVVWQVYDGRLDWFNLVEGDYQRLQPVENGVMRSSGFPGLWLSVEALQAGDLATVLETLGKGLRAPEHKKFVGSDA